MSTQTTSIRDMLDMNLDFDVDEFVDHIGFDADEEPWRTHDGEERSLAFDILWTDTGTYPPEIDDPVVEAILDDEDHNYRIEFPDRETQASQTGMALFGYLDDAVNVEVVE